MMDLLALCAGFDGPYFSNTMSAFFFCSAGIES